MCVCIYIYVWVYIYIYMYNTVCQQPLNFEWRDGETLIFVFHCSWVKSHYHTPEAKMIRSAAGRFLGSWFTKREVCYYHYLSDGTGKPLWNVIYIYMCVYIHIYYLIGNMEHYLHMWVSLPTPPVDIEGCRLPYPRTIKNAWRSWWQFYQ